MNKLVHRRQAKRMNQAAIQFRNGAEDMLMHQAWGERVWHEEWSRRFWLGRPSRPVANIDKAAKKSAKVAAHESFAIPSAFLDPNSSWVAYTFSSRIACAKTCMNSTPISLLERLRRPGDSDAWERFVGLYTPLLCHWVCSTGLQEADAADLVQDVLAVLVSKMPEFAYDPSKSFHGWLRTLVINRWHDLYKRKRVKHTSIDPIIAFVPDPIDSFIEKEFRSRLALKALKIMRSDFEATTFQAVWDLVVETKPAEEVAKKYNMTIGALYASKCRVLSRLRDELKGLWI